MTTYKLYLHFAKNVRILRQNLHSLFPGIYLAFFNFWFCSVVNNKLQAKIRKKKRKLKSECCSTKSVSKPSCVYFLSLKGQSTDKKDFETKVFIGSINHEVELTFQSNHIQLFSVTIKVFKFDFFVSIKLSRIEMSFL